MRYFFEIAYHGERFHGWQRQNNALSVQEVVEECLSTLLKEAVDIVASGRTDAGGHCRQQYFHVDLSQELDDRFIWKINSFLPGEIAIKSIHPVGDQAQARFDAGKWTYQYMIHQSKDPFMRGRSAAVYKELNLEKMNEACRYLLGEHDFMSFSRTKTDVNTYICHIFEAFWQQIDDHLVFQISANRFLRGMVRAIVGTLLEMGEGKKKVNEMVAILQSRERKNAGAAAPAEGLYLVGVTYPQGILKD